MRKKLQKIRLVICIFIISLIDIGCGSSNDLDEAEQKQTIADEVNNDDETENNLKTRDENEIEEVEDNTSVSTVIQLKDAEPFSENVAWVEYSIITDSGEEQEGGFGLLNTDGAITPLSLPDEINNMGSDFSGGYSYINYKKSDQWCFIIIDNEGNTVSKSPDDAEYTIECGGDNWYLVRKMVRSMETSEDLYGIIDCQGNWIYEPTIDFMFGYEQGSDSMLNNGAEYSYLGNGFFHARWVPNTMGRNIPLNVVLDAKNEGNKIIELPLDDYYESYVRGVDNNTVIWSCSSNNGGSVYCLKDDGTSTELANIEHGGFDVKYSDGIIYIATEGGENARFLNTNGDVIADYSKYVINRKKTVCEFWDGYAAVIINGADGYEYLEIIDTSGVCSFEPMKLKSSLAFINGKMACKLFEDDDKNVWVDHQGIITDCCFDSFKDLDFRDGYAFDKETLQYISINGDYLDIFLLE